jgi:hypothetical protein
MSDFHYEPGTAVIPTDDYLNELRKRICGDPHQLATFDQYVNMVAELEEKLEAGDPHVEIEKLSQRIETLRHDLDREEGIVE